ncbi:permease [Bacteroidia bacterium]|nr:permease [Bacteroidia bacterium]
MRQAFIKLHLSIILAGFTGVLGKVITLNEGLLVWYRLMITVTVMLCITGLSKNLLETWRVASLHLMGMMGTGALLALHWVFFFGSIKASNVSIGVICFSVTGFFTAILEPLMNRRRISIREVLFSMIALAGIMLVFHLDIRYRTGILLGIVSSLFCALFTITNKMIGKEQPVKTILLYEMIGGFLCVSLLLPAYLHYFPVATLIPSLHDIFYLIIFAVICTVGLYLLQIEVLKSVSAFTLNLSYNLEPVYSIIIAMLFLGEAKELSLAFYIGLSLIILSVLLQSLTVMKRKTGKADSMTR